MRYLKIGISKTDDGLAIWGGEREEPVFTSRLLGE